MSYLYRFLGERYLR